MKRRFALAGLEVVFGRKRPIDIGFYLLLLGLVNWFFGRNFGVNVGGAIVIYRRVSAVFTERQPLNGMLAQQKPRIAKRLLRAGTLAQHRSVYAGPRRLNRKHRLRLLQRLLFELRWLLLLLRSCQVLKLTLRGFLGIERFLFLQLLACFVRPSLLLDELVGELLSQRKLVSGRIRSRRQESFVVSRDRRFG